MKSTSSKKTSFGIAATLLTVAMTGVASNAQADDTWSFKDVSINQFFWSGRTKDNTENGFAKKADFTYLEIEGGLGGKWGDIYGFFDIENPLNSGYEEPKTKDRRFAMKASANFNLFEVGGLPVQLHMQVYDFKDRGFNDQNRVAGIGTAIFKGDFWIKPFIGFHQEIKSDGDSNFATGAHMNGGMFGWVLGYSFKLGGQSMMITNWHETEFARKELYRFMADVGSNGAPGLGSAVGQNGAVSLWWNINKSFTVGTTYRYASHKLGSATYQDGLILTGRFNF